MSLKIAFDMDNTIFNFMEVLLKEYNKKYSDNIQISDLTEYDFSDKIKISSKQFFKEFATNANFKKMTAYQYAKEFIDTLHDLKEVDVEIYFVSAGHPKTFVSRDNLLSKTFSWYSTSQLIMIREKSLLDLDVLFDDYEKNFDNSSYGEVLVSQPWNKKEKRFERLDSWEEWYKKLKSVIEREEE